jgi:glycogen(starch) synthase
VSRALQIEISMKVLAFTPQYLPSLGGIEILVDMLAQSLRHRSIEKVVVTDRLGLLPDREVINDTVVHRLDFTRAIQSRDTSGPLKVLHQLVRVFETENPSLIHLHSATQASAWYVDRLIGKLPSRPPLVVTQHGTLEAADRLRIVRELLINADVLTAVSSAVLRSATEFSNRTAFSTVICNGIRPFDGVVRTHGPHGRHRLTCVGRLQREKGFDIAVAALAKVRSEGLEAELTIIGQGEFRGTIEKAALDLDIADHVRLMGALDHRSTRNAIAESSLVLIPSRTREGFSLVAAEAAISGVPCVATRVGGLGETVEHEVSGLLVAPNDPDDLAAAVIALLRDGDRARAFGANARRRAREKFDQDTCVERYQELYLDLAHRNKGPSQRCVI